jgi:hypothetical protein
MRCKGRLYICSYFIRPRDVKYFDHFDAIMCPAMTLLRSYVREPAAMASQLLDWPLGVI